MRTRAAGFTLIELLVALAIFAVLSGLAYSGLAAVVRAREHLAAQAEALARLQLAVGILERDLRQAAARPIRDRYGEQRPALVGTRDTIELSTLSATSTAIPGRPAIVRVGYRSADEKLARAAWPVLDRTPATNAAARELVAGVERMELRYLDRSNQWVELWPPPRGESITFELLPRAVEVRLTLHDLGQVSRIVELPEPAEPRVTGPRGGGALPAGPGTP